MMKILVLDNYDSFTYNLVHLLREAGHEPTVVRNDKITVEEAGQYDKILLSPGPGVPDEAGVMKDLIRTYAPTKSILGICLGHQGIAEVFGARLYNLSEVKHGVTSMAFVDDPDEVLFRNLPLVFQVCHYHSWAVLPQSVPADLRITASGEGGLVLGIRHTRYDVRGLQFHPESVMTPEGAKIIQNWLDN
jgi:anthranilate synthase component 2